MSFHISQPIVFFTVDKDYRTQSENNETRSRIERVLDNLEITYQKGIGSFNGNVEVSYKVALNKFYLIKNIVFNITGQDSVLEVRRDKTALLWESNDQVKELGKLKNVSQHQAQEAGNYSIFDNRFFIIE